jgi:hypothetical protein
VNISAVSGELVLVGVEVAGSVPGEAVGGTGVSLANGSTVNVALTTGSVGGIVGETRGIGDNVRQATNSKSKGIILLRIMLIIAVSQAFIKTLSSLS